MSFCRHAADWTQEKISRFWDHEGQKTDNYFCRQVGDGIIKLAKQYFPISGNILDYGAGDGYFATLLSKAGANSVHAYDPCSHLVSRIENQGDTVTLVPELGTLPNEHYNYVFLIAVIEHIPPEDLSQVIQSLYRSMVRGGKLFVVTLDQEDLEKSKVVCPDCGCVFHYVQHITSWDRWSLRRLMDSNGFISLISDTTDLHLYSRSFIVRLSYWCRFILMNEKYGHLFWIGEKP